MTRAEKAPGMLPTQRESSKEKAAKRKQQRESSKEKAAKRKQQREADPINASLYT
jgi:hypothetical protein